jgi:outer membrane protein OmpA-like peptidoglycan-associated protein
MLDPLTAQLEDQGYQTLFACESRGCGGFDFRFGIDLIPTPDMFVDLGDFRYLAARKAATDGPEYVTLLVSRTSVTGFVHIVTIGNGPSDVQVTPSTKTMDTPLLADIDTSLVQQLEQNGHVILSDLAFETGSSTLGPQTFSSLTRLASYLNERRDRQVALVGHTDAQGSLAGNIALSKRRAAAVRTRLIERYDVEPTQMEAEGVGYLAPVASNLTAEGRDANRRVEVILRSTD